MKIIAFPVVPLAQVKAEKVQQPDFYLPTHRKKVEVRAIGATDWKAL